MSLNSIPTSTTCEPTSGRLMMKKKIGSEPEKFPGPRLNRTHLPISHKSPKSADSSFSCWDLQLSSPHLGSFLFFQAWKSFSSSWTPRHFFICQNSCWKVRWWDLSSWERVVCLMLEILEMHTLFRVILKRICRSFYHCNYRAAQQCL